MQHPAAYLKAYIHLYLHLVLIHPYINPHCSCVAFTFMKCGHVLHFICTPV
ncbi:hypothetical protein AG1IA_06734 [Rhizoctonia solani AG-1 IA]|uniref:Uncharacterized protein n=1 Tax=Thanatephorus cucumeris (strain AG1-IA) TaxID=983506 RepID=L8WMQ6_THACA|nr:hypothetical protein AG1IA_06734 [Rhizoctonia solani AG-1 IA]